MPTSALPSLAPPAVWKLSPTLWLLVGLSGLACIAAFLPGLQFMVRTWDEVEEYSYGYFIPFVSAFLVWQRSDRLREQSLAGSWSGLWLVALALLLGAVGSLSAIRTFSQYGFIVALFGMTVCLFGWRGLRIVGVPLAILVFMIPLPQFLLRELSQQLQLLSSQLGVGLIRLFNISVFLEGNVIDLGSMKLQVVEACSGLRYLFPLMVLGFLAAYFFNGAWWKRALIVISTVPLTILINSLRIGVIGITVEHWGPAMAEGVLHDFEGFFMFMLCIALLVLEMSVLARIGGRTQSLRTVFGLDYPAPPAANAAVVYRRAPGSAIAGAVLLLAAATTVAFAPSRENERPQRESFASFPMTLAGGWQGRPEHLDADVLAILAVDDHLIANYAQGDGPWVNFYSAYYDSQSNGGSTHSPRTCIPGGGWVITSITEDHVATPQGRIAVNRVLIEKGEQRQLVYYWFSQRGRILTNEYAVKWFILQDAITRGRSDGALLRVVTPILPSEQVAQADQRLAAFLQAAEPRLAAYVPR